MSPLSYASAAHCIFTMAAPHPRYKQFLLLMPYLLELAAPGTRLAT